MADPMDTASIRIAREVREMFELIMAIDPRKSNEEVIAAIEKCRDHLRKSSGPETK